MTNFCKWKRAGGSYPGGGEKKRRSVQEVWDADCLCDRIMKELFFKCKRQQTGGVDFTLMGEWMNVSCGDGRPLRRGGGKGIP